MDAENNASEILDFFLKTKGYTQDYITPYEYYVDLYMNGEQYQTILGNKKQYTEGALNVQIGDLILKNKEFVLSSSDFISSNGLYVSRKKKFYSYSLNAEQLKTGDVINVDGFDKGVIVGIEEGYYADTLDDKINKLFDSFSMFKTYNKDNIKTYIKEKYNINADIVSTDDLLMIRDLSQTNDGLSFHDGGKVDIYYTENTFGIKTFIGNAISTAGEEVMTADSAYFPSFGNPLKDYKYPINDIDLTAWSSFFDVNADKFIKKDLFYIEMSQSQDPNLYPVMGIESVMNSSGEKLVYNEDYIYISVDRGYTFTDKNKVLIFFKTNPGSGVSIKYIAPLKYRENQNKIENDPYIAPIGVDVKVKVKPVVFAQLNGIYSGLISDIGINSEIASFENISMNRLNNLLKTNGAQELSTTKMTLTAHSYSLGRFSSETTNPQHQLKMNNFSGKMPFDNMTDFSIMAVNPNVIIRD
jgi:hypothetical protein